MACISCDAILPAQWTEKNNRQTWNGQGGFATGSSARVLLSKGSGEKPLMALAIFRGRDVAQLVQSHQHAANASSIPRCSKGFFSRSQLLVQTLVIQCPYTPCAITCINICVHIKDHVLHVRVWWIMETLKHPACTVGWVVRLPQLAFPGTATQISHGKNPNEAVQL